MYVSRKNQTPGKEVCRFFSRKGWYRYGSSCWFQHDEPPVKTKQSEPEIEIEKMMEGMQEARKTLAMAETAQKNMLNQLADRDREIVKLRDTLEGMEVRASKAERQVVSLHSTDKERDTYRLVMAFVVISCVAIVMHARSADALLTFFSFSLELPCKRGEQGYPAILPRPEGARSK